MDKLELDPYEIPKNGWQDDVDLLLAIMHIHACMYLTLIPSPYSKNTTNYTEVWTSTSVLCETG